MYVWAIRDKKTGVMWSRNKWACATSVPDLYKSRENAQKQVDQGKISIMRRYKLGSFDAEVVRFWLTEIVGNRMLHSTPYRTLT